MAKARKGKSSGNNSKGSGVSGSAIFVIVAIAVLLVLYAMKENPDWSNQLEKVTSNETVPATKSAKKDPVRKQAPKKTTKANSSPKTESKTEEKKFEEDKIDAQNGARETVNSNENLPVYTTDDNYYYASSFDFAWPAYKQNEAIVEHSHYTLRYNEKTEQAVWVAYKLTRVNLLNSKIKPKSNFRVDPDIKTKSSTPQDYKGSGHDIGQWAPTADFVWSREGRSESFFMSNTYPQRQGFNNSSWRILESKVRQWAKSNKEIYVVSGPIFRGAHEKIGKNKVVVPDQCYKVILELNGKEVKGIGFILDNEKTSKDLSAFAMSIDEVEKASGLDFFPSIPDALEKKIEQTYNYALWK